MGPHTLPKARFEPPSVRAIVRERVDRRLDRAWAVPLTLVVGPAGAGKTTAVSHLAARSPQPVLWYRAHPVDADESVLCEHLAQAVAHATGERGEWAHLADLLVDIEQRPLLPRHIVVDEFDAIIGTASERAFDVLLADLAPTIHLVTLSRHRPSFSTARLRLADGVCEIGPDDLRFRSWEVDRLFRELYQRPLPPDEVAELERRTGGWVAALQLFNMATSGLAAGERRAVLAQVGRRAGPDWDFLAENVLAALTDELQLFMLETSPLPRLSAELCDDLLGSGGSIATLAELERLQLVTPSPEAPGVYRTHEVLRSHLEGLLLEWEGTDAVRSRYRRAADTLERHGLFADALSAYCRGDDWPSASRLLGSRGAEVADKPGSWLAGVPPTLIASDPWLLLAVARNQRADGRVADAVATYQRVERSALSAVPVTIARRERLLLASLLDRSSPPPSGWVGIVRDAVRGGPLADTDLLGTRSTYELLAVGLASLLRGEIAAARATLHDVRQRPDVSAVVAIAASLGDVVAAELDGSASIEVAAELERAAAALDVPFLARMCRAAAAMVTGAVDDIAAVVAECDRVGDSVGAAGAAVLGELATVWSGRPADVSGLDALGRCDRLGLLHVEVWVQVAVALRATAAGEEAPATAAEVAAKRRGLRPLERLAHLARVAAAPATAEPDRLPSLAAELREEHGLLFPLVAVPAAAGDAPPVASLDKCRVDIRCFGRFVVLVDDAPVDLGALRPRARAVLRMLAVRLGHGVHRDVLGEELWPDDDEASAAKKLQVAISSIRRVLEEAGVHDLVRRDGDVYALRDDAVMTCDVHRFSSAVADARAAVASGDQDAAEATLRRALELYGGDLLADEGATDWVVGERLQLQAAAVDVAKGLGTLLLDRRDPVAAIEVGRRGLEIDHYADPLWRVLLQALQSNEDHAGYAVAASRYDAVLAELGVQREPA
jgi:DNA-binding SARP family transcriptional activator